jgi:hypothetical protein
MRTLRTVRGWLVVFTAAFTVSSYSLFLSKGPSMLPTIQDPSLLVVLPHVFRTPGRGDVAVLQRPWGGSTTVVKRITAVAGDCIPGGSRAKTLGAACEVIPPGFMFVVGDNEPFSDDSRSAGLVRVTSAIGTVMLAAPLQPVVGALGRVRRNS